MPVNLTAPHQKYFLESGQEVPGCTTVVKDTSGFPHNLKWWFWDQGRKGCVQSWKNALGALLDDPPSSLSWQDFARWAEETIDVSKGTWPIPDDVTEADLGKVIHARAEAYLRGYDGIEGADPALVKKSEHAYKRFVDRWEASGYKKLGTEIQMVSERLRVGGTLDILCECPNRGVGIVDIKSSKPYRNDVPYEEVLVQVGGYSIINHHMTTDSKSPISNWIFWAEVWRVGKSEKDEGSVYPVADLNACEMAFESAVEHFYRKRKIR